MDAYDAAPYQTQIIATDGAVIKEFRYDELSHAETGYAAYVEIATRGYPDAAGLVLTNRVTGEVIKSDRFIETDTIEGPGMTGTETERSYKEAFVVWDTGTDTPPYPALVIEGERWNGFALPYFNRATVDRMIADTEKLATVHPEGVQTLRWEGHNVVIHDSAYQDEEGYVDETCVPVVIAGIPHWPIGAWEWTWVEVEPEPEARPTFAQST